MGCNQSSLARASVADDRVDPPLDPPMIGAMAAEGRPQDDEDAMDEGIVPSEQSMKVEPVRVFASYLPVLDKWVQNFDETVELLKRATPNPGTQFELCLAAAPREITSWYDDPGHYDDAGDIPISKLVALIEAILAIGNLHKITIDPQMAFFVHGEPSLLNDVFSRCKHLQHFESDSLHVVENFVNAHFGYASSQKSFEAFGRALGKLPSLEFLKMRHCHALEEEGPIRPLCLHQLGRSISVVKMLIMKESISALTDQDVAHHHLWLQQLFEACQNCRTLEHLHWETFNRHLALRPSDLGAVDQMIQNTSSLKTLILTVHSDTNIESLAEAMKNNKTIQELEFRGELEQNYPLPRSQRPVLDVVTTISEATAFRTLLEDHNFALVSLHRSPWLQWRKAERESPWVTVQNQVADLPTKLPKHSAMLPVKVQAQMARICLLLQLNNAARGKLVGPTADTNNVIHAIIDQKHDISFVFYYLQQNPALCKLALP